MPRRVGGGHAPAHGKGVVGNIHSGVERITQHRLTEFQSEQNTSPPLYLFLLAKRKTFQYNRGCGNSLQGYGAECCITHHRNIAGCRPLCSAAIYVSKNILTYNGRNCKGLFPEILGKEIFLPFCCHVPDLLNLSTIFFDSCGVGR